MRDPLHQLTEEDSQHLTKAIDTLTFPEVTKSIKKNIRSYRVPILGAGILLGIGIVCYYRWRPEERKIALSAGNKVIIQRCGHSTACELTLPDSSKVKLCYNSSLRYLAGFRGGQRDVYLDGQAVFEVKADKNKPFIVHAGHTAVRVLGTIFNVMAYSDESRIEITLISGAVEVINDGDKRLLQPADQAVIEGSIISIRHLDFPENFLSWSGNNPLLEFDNVDLSTVIQRLARCYQVKVFNPDHIQGFSVTGVLMLNHSLESNLEMLRTIEEISIHLNGRGDTILLTKSTP